MNYRQQELQKAIEFVRRTFADKRILLDYSTESVRHLDKLLDDEFKKGKLKNPDGSFAKFQGLIMIGISGYLAQVILKNAPGSTLSINEDDKNWFINFTITHADNRTLQPGLQALKRVQSGSDAALYSYVIAGIKYFNNPGSQMPDQHKGAEQKKQWWKIWKG